MKNLDDVSILIVTRMNNLHRFLFVIDRIRSMYSETEIVVVFDDVDPPKNIDHLNLITVRTDKRVYVSGGYNLAMKHSTKSTFVFLHDDTIICENFLQNIIENITPQQFCNFTLIEPPIYNKPNTKATPIIDLGRDSRHFSTNYLDRFYESHVASLEDFIIPSPYGGFFMGGYKESFWSVGGFDESFQPFFHEDDDLMLRLLINNYKFVHSLKACVYHMGSMTSRIDEQEEMQASQKTARIFFQKWGTSFHVFKLLTIDKKIPFIKRNYKIETNKPESKLNGLVSYDKTQPLTTVSIDLNQKLTENGKQLIYRLPYVVNDLVEKNIQEWKYENITIST